MRGFGKKSVKRRLGQGVRHWGYELKDLVLLFESYAPDIWNPLVLHRMVEALRIPSHQNPLLKETTKKKVRMRGLDLDHRTTRPRILYQSRSEGWSKFQSKSKSRNLI